MRVSVVSAFCFLLSASPLLAASLAWDRPVCTNIIAHYHLYSGSHSGGYTNSLNVLTNRHPLPKYPGHPVYFAVTAVDTFGLESDYSNELGLWLDAHKTNLQVTVTTTGTGLLWSPSPTGPWTYTNRTTLVFTNPPGARYFRSRGPTANHVTVTPIRF